MNVFVKAAWLIAGVNIGYMIGYIRAINYTKKEIIGAFDELGQVLTEEKKDEDSTVS